MDSEIEKYVKKQIQLQEKIEELFAENKILKNNLSVLCECLSLEKIKRKIFELENKQKLLNSLESMITKLQADVKPLEYLKQTLQKQFMVSTVSNDDSVDVNRKDMESSDLTINSGCAIETLDSASDVSSEESVVVLSEYDVVSDGEVCGDTERTVNNKVMYAEALKMAASEYFSLNESFISNIGYNELLSNESDRIKDVDHRVQSESKETVVLMNASSKSEQLLEMYDVVNKKDILKCDENVSIYYFTSLNNILYSYEMLFYNVENK